jgi:hypothetical protein
MTLRILGAIGQLLLGAVIIVGSLMGLGLREGPLILCSCILGWANGIAIYFIWLDR